MHLRIYLIALAISLSGCQSVLMRTPIVVAEGHMNPMARVRPEMRTPDVPVFVASTRTPSGRDDPGRFYSGDRSKEVRLGRATVAIGPGMTWEELAEESSAAKRTRNPKVRVTGYEEFGPLWTTAAPKGYGLTRDWDGAGIDRDPSERFAEAINGALDDSTLKQVRVYVHGFNTKFEGHLELAAETFHYLARDGAIISFDWPSRGSLLAYQADAEVGERQLRKLLEFLASDTDAQQINILAHSAGNPVVVEALRQLSLMHWNLDAAEAHRITKIGRVVLAAPDMDLDMAVSAGHDGAGRLVRGFAMYASRKDRALGLSSAIFKDVRVGRSIGTLEPEERASIIDRGLQWIDATGAQRRAGSFLGHSYYHQNPLVSSDVLIFLVPARPPRSAAS